MWIYIDLQTQSYNYMDLHGFMKMYEFTKGLSWIFAIFKDLRGFTYLTYILRLNLDFREFTLIFVHERGLSLGYNSFWTTGLVICYHCMLLFVQLLLLLQR